MRPRKKSKRELRQSRELVLNKCPSCAQKSQREAPGIEGIDRKYWYCDNKPRCRVSIFEEEKEL